MVIHQPRTRRLSRSDIAPKPFDPTVVSRGLQTPSRALDPEVNNRMHARFGRDFSGVRVHTDPVAGRSARAIDARAYAVGSDVVFEGYSPGNMRSEQLLAHELAHVAQNDAAVGHASLRLGEQAGQAEREADAAANGGEVTAKPSGVVHRSLLGGILGGIGGALGGALLGGLIGGPIGAIIGGVAGLIGGAIAGNAVSTDERALNNTVEIPYAREIFRDSIDYTPIRITRDSMYSAGAPLTIGNTIHLKSSWGHFKGDTMELTNTGLETLIHEMAHVWQYQNGGLAYIPLSLIAQFGAFVSGGDRNEAYNWREVHRAGRPWASWNPEQQASAVEDYNKLLRKSKDGSATLAEMAELSILVGYMASVWHREGAPHLETPDLKDSPL
ncbi:MAG: DUF4157 domain-containing protein [Anaerolineaceae bacterium]